MRSKSVIFMLDPFILPRLNGIAAFAAAHNWILVPDDRVSPQTDYRRFDGALCSLRGRSPQLTKIRRLLSLNKPVVDLTVACDSIRVPRVASDHLACGRLAASHLLSLGIDNIVWYASATSKVHRLRYNGVARELGRPPTRLSPATLRHELMHSEKPLGVVAYSETDAERVISECKRLSLDIPDVVAVISIGNDPFLCENREITISAVDTNLAQGAYEAARLLDTFIESPRKWQRARSMVRLIPPQSVVPRKSTDTLTHPCGLIRDVLIYIHRHLDRPLGASEVAEACAIARTTLDRNFRKVIGHSIGSEILNQRMQLAKRLLRDCELPLKTIAARCGFCNQAFFSTVFKSNTGRTPSQWRKTTGQGLRPDSKSADPA